MGVVAHLVVKVSASISEFSKELQGLEKQWSSTGSKLQTVGSDLTKTVTLPILAVGVAAFKAATDFETAFSGVAKTVDGVAKPTGELTAFGQKLKQEFRDLAKEIPVSVGELSKIGEAAGAMGIGKDKILGFVEVMAKLGATTDLTSDQAATGIAKIQNVYRAAGVDTDRFAASLVALGNAGASTESQILSFAERMGGAASGARISQAEILGWSNAMASVGLNAELGSTAWNKFVSSIGMAVDMGGAKLKLFAETANMPVAAFQQLFKTDASEAVNRVVEGFGRIQESGGNLTKTMIDMGMKHSGMQMTFKNLAASGDQLRTSLDLGKKAWQDNIAMEEEFAKKSATVQSQLKVLFNHLYDIGITLGDTMIPAFKNMKPALESALGTLANLVQWFAALPQPIQTATFVIAGLVAAIGPLAFAMGTIMRTGASFIGLLKTMGVVGTATGVGTTAAAGGVSLLQTALMRFAAVVGVAFAGWQVGKWIDQWTGLSDVIGRVTARLSGVNGATYDAMRSSQQLAEAWKAAGIVGTNNKDIELPAEKKPAAAPVALPGLGVGDATAKLSAFEQAVKSLTEKIGGSNLVDTANQWVAAISKIGGIGKLTHDELTQFTEDIAAAVEKMRLLGQEVPRTWAIIADTVKQDAALQKTRDFIGQSLQGFEMNRQQVYLPGAGMDFAATSGLMQAVPQAIASQNVSAEVAIAGDTVARAFKGGWNASIASLPQTIMAALTGGGDVGKSVGALFGGEILGGLSGKLTQGLSGMFGKTIGGALGSVIPGLGTLLGSMIGPLIGKLASKIWSGIQGVFGTDEEARDVNPARDAFLAKFGGAGTGAGSGFQTLAAKLTELTGEGGGGALFQALTQADTMAEFNAAVAAIEEKLASVNTSATEGFTATTTAADGMNLSLQGSDEAIKALGETQLTVVNVMLQGFDALMVKLSEFINALNAARSIAESMPVPQAAPADMGVWNPGADVGYEEIPAFANEGIVRRPTLAMIGDAPEPEYVLRESTVKGLASSRGNGGPTIHVSINGGTIIGNSDEFRDAVVHAYQDAVEKGGRAFQKHRKLSALAVQAAT